MLPQITDYIGLMGKLKYNLDRYKKDNNIYELLDCLMTLNAIPEWIVNSKNTKTSLTQIAEEKLAIMKGKNGFILDETKLSLNINHQLRLIRLICNHSKHKTDSILIPRIQKKYGGTLPASFPIKLYNIIAIGENEYDAEYLLNSVANFWFDAVKLENENFK
ncbi:hypothetical protein [Maribacter cobaltidurans]|uniref:Uncharacterized protein n=1 Tax=Maribacter cobaltidurans TaxID=1178778 RepID=A0A223V0L3_9FLAO|nr:hypothetical protein [Maribacter cobaltidurans]ASV29003.1 hypothetical protein CJ263_01465 [Maribacter cobaltidurans]GGD72793.1 hypothetical protein GCM10011412_08010 [Maribacter cobaltidurans]